jgi:hypothetical protein
MKLLTDIKKKSNKKIKEINKEYKLKNDFVIDFLKKEDNKLILKYHDSIILEGTYNFYGVYKLNDNIWFWASSIIGTSKENLKQIRKIKSFSYLFEKMDDIKGQFYYQFLNNDIILITNDVMLTWINELLLYLSDDIYPLNPKNNNTIQFLNISKITQKYN